uniref:ZP domain-containing protein n=1 Tax=Mola mola TaxID=94237 RepID=A0A3Q4AB74_MOLML
VTFVLSLNTTTQSFHGVELSKDQRGITLNMPFTNTTVFFDGNTAHLYLLLEPVPPVEGLCGNSTNFSQTTTLSAAISTSYSFDGCEIQYNDTDNSTVNCNDSTEHCNLMNQTFFADCHSFIDPEPYMNACKNTLCNYQMVDGLRCQFFEAYAMSCNLKHSITLEDWSSSVNCSANPQAFCQDQYCSTHEFCGEKLGETRCLCRAIFASNYKPTNASGEALVCRQNSVTLTLVGCLLEEINIDHSDLHLNDQNCTGHMDQQTHMVTFSFNSSNTCGAEVTMNNSHLTYMNTIMLRNNSMNDIITRDNQFLTNFSCVYNQPVNQTASFSIRDGPVIEQIVSGVWNYTLMMSAYVDSGRTNLVGSTTEVQLNQKIWVKLKTEGLDGNMVALVTDSCWATNQSSPHGGLQHDLIINQCPNPVDKTVTVEGNGEGTFNFFSFNMFQFPGKDSDVHLHCKLELCPTQSGSCVPSCSRSGRRKRSSSGFKAADENSAIISMVWTY